MDNLPEEGTEVKVGDQTYVKYGDVFYQPVQVDGRISKYELVQIEKDEKAGNTDKTEKKG